MSLTVSTKDLFCYSDTRMPQKKKSRSSSKTVPYVKGPRPTTASEQSAAKELDASPEFLPQGGHFSPMPEGVSIDDWSSQYKKGQTYEDFLHQTPWLSGKKVKYMKSMSEGDNLPTKYPNGAIYILPVGPFDKSGVKPNFGALVEYTQIFFGLPVKTLPQVKLELDLHKSQTYWVDETRHGEEFREEIPCRYNVRAGHHQACVDKIMVKLLRYMPGDGICLIALTMCDLFEVRPDLFVVGMSTGDRRIAIFSLCRYDPDLTFSKDFWFSVTSDHKSTADHKRLLLMRSCRLIVREISHLLGLAHCTFFECCMNGSANLAEAFRQPMFLCPVDLRKLQKLCGFDVLERYDRVINFHERHDTAEVAQWYQKRVDYLKR